MLSRIVLLISVALVGCGDDTTGDSDGGAGSEVGDTLQPFTLSKCDGTPYTFSASAATYTVISLAAGWCQPCTQESQLLEERVTDAYADRGVVVVQALTQKADFSDPDGAFCSEWASTYGLSNIEVIDPDGELNTLWPTMALPSTTIVDSNGVIVFREIGATDGITSLTAKLDELLAE